MRRSETKRVRRSSSYSHCCHKILYLWSHFEVSSSLLRRVKKRTKRERKRGIENLKGQVRQKPHWFISGLPSGIGLFGSLCGQLLPITRKPLPTICESRGLRIWMTKNFYFNSAFYVESVQRLMQKLFSRNKQRLLGSKSP